MEDLIIIVTHNTFTHVTCIMMWRKNNRDTQCFHSCDMHRDVEKE